MKLTAHGSREVDIVPREARETGVSTYWKRQAGEDGSFSADRAVGPLGDGRRKTP